MATPKRQSSRKSTTTTPMANSVYPIILTTSRWKKWDILLMFPSMISMSWPGVCAL